MIVKSKVYKGIEYIQLSELPREQQEILANSLNRSLLIKIMINGKVVSDCLQFRDYKIWYESIFKIQTTTELAGVKKVNNKIFTATPVNQD
jgi:hypothetical protein